MMNASNVSIGDMHSVIYESDINDEQLMQYMRNAVEQPYLMPGQDSRSNEINEPNIQVQNVRHNVGNVHGHVSHIATQQHQAMPHLQHQAHPQAHPQAHAQPRQQIAPTQTHTNTGNVRVDYQTSGYQQHHDEGNQYPNQRRYDYSHSDLSPDSHITHVSDTLTSVSETDASLPPHGHGYNTVQASPGDPVHVPPNYNMVSSWDQQNQQDQHRQQHPPSSYHSLSSGNQNEICQNQVKNNQQQLNASNNLKATSRTASHPHSRVSNSIPNILTSSTPNSFHTFKGIHQNTHHHKSIQEREVVEKRTLIIFKVIDQVVDSSGKVLSENVIKDEQVITSLGKMHWPDNQVTPTSTLSSLSISRPQSGSSSGLLADISSSQKSTLSSRLSSHSIASSNESNNLNVNANTKTKTSASTSEKAIKSPTPVVAKNVNQKSNLNVNVNVNSTHKNQVNSEESKSRLVAVESSLSSPTNVSKNDVVPATQSAIQIPTPMVEIEDPEEDERRETASALLSLLGHKDIKIPIEKPFSEDQPFLIKPNNKVLAKWRDKNFYPGIIKEGIQNNKWEVIFEDGATRKLFENEIINVESIPKNTIVMVNVTEGFCIKGTVRSSYTINGEMFYDIENLQEENGELNAYPRKEVFLTSEQATILLNHIKKPQSSNAALFADVDLDNIVSGKRIRQVKLEEKEKVIEIEEQTKVSKPRRRQAEPGESRKGQVHEAIPRKRKKRMKLPQGKCTIVVPNESSLNESTHSNSPLSISPRTIRSNSVSMPPQELVRLLGPLPEKNKIIFRGISFLLTCGDRDNNEGGRSTPFEKEYLIRQIEEGDGRVYETFEEAKASQENLDDDNHDDNEIVLIADTYHRSMKYMQCLAAGVPVISHMWIIECCRKNQVVKRENYFLPSGYSIISNSLPSDKLVFKKSANLFKGMRFYYGSENPSELDKLWSPILLAAQAIIIKELPASIGTATRKVPNSIDMIIGDATCDPELVKKMKQLKIPIVSGEYVVQCLINGRKLAVEQHPKFEYTCEPASI